jgi:hypothetical protein
LTAVSLLNNSHNMKVLLWMKVLPFIKGPSWPLSYGSWIYNYQCNQYLSPLMLWVWISIRERCTTLCDNVCQWLAIFCLYCRYYSMCREYAGDVILILLSISLYSGYIRIWEFPWYCFIYTHVDCFSCSL